MERAKSLRFAEANGGYDAFFQKFNDGYGKSRAFSSEVALSDGLSEQVLSLKT